MNSTVARSTSQTRVRYWCPLAMAFSSTPRCGVTRGRLVRWPRSTARSRMCQALIPTDGQNPGGPANVGLLQHIDCPTLEQCRGAGRGLGPRAPHLADAVGAALEP